MERRGTSILPLHYGHPPEYLFKRMVELGGTLCDIIIQEYGVDTLLEKLSDPFWFHSFSLVTGFDWNSSGTTTATLAAIKEYYVKHDGAIRVIGGKGERMGRASAEADNLAGSGYISESKVPGILSKAKSIARIDNNLLQDGYDLYLQFIVIDSSGKWAVIQQGMDQGIRMARRYHWIWSSRQELVNDARNGVSSFDYRPESLDLSTRLSERNRNSMVEVAGDDPEVLRRRVAQEGQSTLDRFSGETRELRLDRSVDWKKLRMIYEYSPSDFMDLMNINGVGKSTIRALSYLAEVIHGEPPSFQDPVKYSFALGGKDGIPKPVNVHDYDVAIEFYRDALGSLGSGDRNVQTLIRNLSRISYLRSGQG
jgi:hypothetical protein